MSTQAPSLGRGCRAQRGGVGFLFAAKPPPLCLPHRGRGTAPAVDRVLSFIACLRRSSPLFFILLEPYPARFARHLPHAGKAVYRGYRFPIQPPPLRGTSFHRKEGMTSRAPSLGRGCRAQRGGVGFLFCGEAASSLPSPCRESFVRRYCFSTYACIRFDGARKAAFSYRSLPHWGRGTAQRWIGCSRKRRT